MIRAFRTATLPSLCALALAGCWWSGDSDDAARDAALAASALQSGALGAANTYIRDAIAIRDDISDYWVLKAQIATARGDSQGAYDAYRTVISLDRANADALRALCQLGNRFAQPAELDRFADQLAVLAPNDNLTVVAHGYAALNRGNVTAADRFAEKALAASASDANALILKSQILRRDRKFTEAAALIRQASGTLGPSPALFDALVGIYQQARDRTGYEQAIRELAQADPKNIDAAIKLADLQYQDGDRDAARATITELVHRNPRNIDVAARLLDLWLRQDDALTPEEIVADSAELSLQMQAAYAQYANERRRPDLALRIIGRVRDRGFTIGVLDAKAALAEALALNGQRGTARQLIDAVLAVDSTQPRALIARSRLAWARGDRNAAISDVRQVVAEDAGNATARILLSGYLDTVGETTLSEAALREGMTSDPGATRVATALFRMLIARGKRSAAADLLDDLAVAAPLDLRAQQLRTSLCPETGVEACRGPVKFTTL